MRKHRKIKHKFCPKTDFHYKFCLIFETFESGRFVGFDAGVKLNPEWVRMIIFKDLIWLLHIVIRQYVVLHVFICQKLQNQLVNFSMCYFLEAILFANCYKLSIQWTKKKILLAIFGGKFRFLISTCQFSKKNMSWAWIMHYVSAYNSQVDI